MATRHDAAKTTPASPRRSQAAEAKTSGEIYCVVARASDSYFFPAAFMVTLAHRRRSACSSPICSSVWWYDLPPMTIWSSAQLVAFACALLVLRFFPALRIRLVPRRQRYRACARQRA